MPRRKHSRASTSSEQNMNCDKSETLNLSDELPDPGLPKANGKEVKEKKRVSFNFPVEVITKDGKFTGMGTIDLMETSAPSGQSSKSKENNIVYDLTQDDKGKKQNAQKIKDPPKSPEHVKIQDLMKIQPVKIQEVTKIPEPVKIHDLTKIQQPAKAQETLKNLESSKNKEQLMKSISVVALKSPQDGKREGPVKKTTIKEIRVAKRREEETVREAIKKSIEEEKQAKAQFEEFNKIFRPGECLKHMNIEVHPDLGTAWFMGELFLEAGSAGVRVVMADDICDPGLLMWTRFVPPTLGKKSGQIKLTPTKKQCDHAFYIITAEEVVALLAEGRACQYLAHKQELIGVRLTIVIFGVEQIINGLPNRDGTPRMNGDKFGKAMNHLQMLLMVEKKMEMIMVDTPTELGHLVVHYTRAIAEAPYKIAKRDIDEQAQFYMRGDNKNCVAVDKDGNGLSRLWEQMIAVLPMSSLEIARSLGGCYKTPRALSKEFQTTGGIAKIADIGIARTNVPGAKTRRLGPEFARKLHTLFTTEDGNMVIE